MSAIKDKISDFEAILAHVKDSNTTFLTLSQEGRLSCKHRAATTPCSVIHLRTVLDDLDNTVTQIPIYFDTTPQASQHSLTITPELILNIVKIGCQKLTQRQSWKQAAIHLTGFTPVARSVVQPPEDRFEFLDTTLLPTLQEAEDAETEAMGFSIISEQDTVGADEAKAAFLNSISEQFTIISPEEASTPTHTDTSEAPTLIVRKQSLVNAWITKIRSIL